jgi:hypothetical protein
MGTGEPMQIYLNLAEDGPPFWFLGDPKRLTVSLTYQEPGPIEVEFSNLTMPDQKKILQSIQAGQIESNVPWADMYVEYEKVFSKAAPVRIEPQEPTPKPTGAVQAIPSVDLRVAKEAAFQEKCQKIVKEKLSQLKESLKKEKDIRTLRTIRDLELQKKSPRTSVVNFINLELRKLQSGIIEEIENDDNVVVIEAEPAARGETFVSNVVESDLETVQLTPEMLIGRLAE